MTLRVLSLSTLFPNPAQPALGRFVARQMEAVAARGDVKLTVIAPLGLPPFPLSRHAKYAPLRNVPERREAEGGFAVHHPRFRLIPAIGAAGNPARIARAVLPLARRLHDAAPFDVLDAQFFFPDGPAAARIARALDLPFSIKARGSDIHYWGKQTAALPQMREAAEAAGGMLSVSAALARDMAALGMPQDRIAVHYTGLDAGRFRPATAAEREATRAALDLPAGAPLLLSPGALIPLKGQALAIAALAHVPGAHLLLAGTGPEEESLRQRAVDQTVKRRIHFLGQVPHERLAALMAAADAVVLPSEREGLANVWIESLASGTPLVIPDIGGAREVVMSPDAGRIVERTPEAIASAVSDLLADPPTRAPTARCAERFSWDRNAEELSAHWRKLAG